MELIENTLILIGHIVSLIGLGLVIGFSPTLYITHIAVLANSKHPIRLSIILVAGITTAIVLLALLSELIQPDTIHDLIRSSINSIISYGRSDYFLGLVFIAVGFYYLFKKPSAKRLEASKKVTFGAQTGLYSLGFAKTIISITGFGAVLLGIRIIDASGALPLGKFILFLVLIAATLLPFAVLLYMSKRWKKGFRSIKDLSKKITDRNYDRYIGVVLLTIGGTFILFGIFS